MTTPVLSGPGSDVNVKIFHSLPNFRTDTSSPGVVKYPTQDIYFLVKSYALTDGVFVLFYALTHQRKNFLSPIHTHIYIHVYVVWFDLVLWHVNYSMLFNAKSILYIYKQLNFKLFNLA